MAIKTKKKLIDTILGKDKEKVEKFRNKVLNEHLDIEASLDLALRIFFFGKDWQREKADYFHKLVLTTVNFRRKVEILYQIVRNPKYKIILEKCFTIKIDVNHNTITFLKENTKINYKTLYKHLQKVHDIRNHLCHNICYGFKWVAPVLEKDQKGTEKDFDEAVRYINGAIEKFSLYLDVD